MCWQRWGSAPWPVRRSGSHCRGTPPPPTSLPSHPLTDAWRTGSAPRWCRTQHDPTLPAMTSAPPRPNRPVYLDNQATTRCDPRVVEAMLPWFTEHYGNPHSVEHVMGTEAEAAVEDARERVAALIGADAKELVFTSGATESNNIAIKGAARFALQSGN